MENNHIHGNETNAHEEYIKIMMENWFPTHFNEYKEK